MKIAFTKIQIGSFFALCSAFLFSSKAIFIKQAYALSDQVNATVLMALRMGSALPFFLLMACYFRNQKQHQISTQDWGLLVVAGLMGYYFASWLDFLGLMYISASLERIILFLYPTLTVLASSVIYKQKIRLKTSVAILLSYGGTVLVLLQEQNHAPLQNNFWLGASLVFASAIAFAAYLLLTPRLIAKFGASNFTGLALSVACIGTLIHYWIATPQAFTTITTLPATVWLYGIGLGIFVTVVPTFLLMQSIARLGAAQSAMIAAIGPILTILLAVIFLNEHLNIWQWLGCLLNIAGILMISFSKKALKH
ncbi:DMT family transporter [Acinetobacter sp.]|uniref:DMT family transporter n=1 Tax=Acinetobacter sp. TaxID=472 RepID=UPI0031D731CD